jgi:nucleotide-binding universal stress UspA family protein
MGADRSKVWRGFRALLCPVDFSERSRLALRYAGAVARHARATLTVLYVNDPILLASAAAALHDRHIDERSRRELDAFVDATLGSGAPTVQTCLGSGHPGNEILRIAAQAGADLLVLGTQGLTGAERALMGSTTLSVLRRTTVPVLAVPSRGEEAECRQASPWPGSRIMTAIELDRGARADLVTASCLAHWFGASLLLVHVVEAVSLPAWLMTDRGAHDRIRIAQAQQQLERLAAAARSDVPVETRVICGHPADEIAAAAATEQIRLVVTALRERRGWFGERRGSVSYHVLSHAVTPVLAYPPQWRRR